MGSIKWLEPPPPPSRRDPGEGGLLLVSWSEAWETSDCRPSQGGRKNEKSEAPSKGKGWRMDGWWSQGLKEASCGVAAAFFFPFSSEGQIISGAFFSSPPFFLGHLGSFGRLVDDGCCPCKKLMFFLLGRRSRLRPKCLYFLFCLDCASKCKKAENLLRSLLLPFPFPIRSSSTAEVLASFKCLLLLFFATTI